MCDDPLEMYQGDLMTVNLNLAGAGPGGARQALGDASAMQGLHVGVRCLHVRPCLQTSRPADACRNGSMLFGVAESHIVGHVVGRLPLCA